MTAPTGKVKKPRDKLKPPQAGPGRPRNATSPRTEAQVALADAIYDAEEARDAAASARKTDHTIAAQMLELECEYAVSSAWAAYLRAQGNHTWGLKYQDIANKQDTRLTALRELIAVDELDAIDEALNDDEASDDGLGKRARR